MVEKQKEEKNAKQEKPEKERPKKEKTEIKKEKKSAFSKIKKAVKKEELKPIEPQNTSATTLEPFEIIRFVLMTEKSVQNIELQNKLVFIVNRKSTKNEIKNAVEAAFQKNVSDVKTVIDRYARKKAFVRFKEPGTAGDIAVRLGGI